MLSLPSHLRNHKAAPGECKIPVFQIKSVFQEESFLRRTAGTDEEMSVPAVPVDKAIRHNSDGAIARSTFW